MQTTPENAATILVGQYVADLENLQDFLTEQFRDLTSNRTKKNTRKMLRLS